jgi:hypothetical protein
MGPTSMRKACTYLVAVNAYTLVVATIVFVFLKMREMRAEAGSIPGPIGVDIKVVWIWLLYSPIYWLILLALLGLSVWVFRSWVFSH